MAAMQISPWLERRKLMDNKLMDKEARAAAWRL